MKKKIIIGIIGIALILVAVIIFFVINPAENPNLQKKGNNLDIKIVSVEDVVHAPNQYKNFLGVEGIVIGVDESKNIFLLGCGDACIVMPVRYRGQMPEMKSKIIAYGEIRKSENGKYIFEAQEVKVR